MNPPTLRERQKQRRKQRIYSVAIELFKERGFAKTTATDIAKQAHVSRGTFFNYYPYKESVLLVYGAEVLTALNEQLKQEQQNGASGERLLELLWSGLAEITTRERELIPPLMYEFLNPDPLRSRTALEILPLIQMLQGIVRMLPIRQDMSVERMAGLLANMYFMTALRWSAYAPEKSFQDEMKKTLRLALDGMLAKK